MKKSDPSKKNLTWTTYFRLINKLYNKIDWVKEEFDAIVGINRGGNIIGTLLSHKSRVHLEIINKEQVVNVRGKILIIDDIADTGVTLLKVMSNLKSGTIAKTATLHMQPHTKHKPDFYVSTVRHWVVYPYERVHKRKQEEK